MKIVLVKPPFVSVKYGPPIGLAYISNVLKQSGHDVTLIDMNIDLCNKFSDDVKYTRNYAIDPSDPRVKYAYENLEVYSEKIMELKPDIVVFNLSYPTEKYGVEMAAHMSKVVKCVAIGPLTLHRSKELFEHNSFHAVIVGYPEEAVIDVVNKNQRGIVKKELIKGKEYLPDLTDVPISYYHGFLPIVSSRGCLNRCNFCTRNCEYYLFSIPNVIKQIQNHEKEDISQIFYYDSNININRDRTIELFTEIAKMDKQYKGHIFGLQIEDNFEEYLEKMAEAGVKEVRVGVESGSLRERISMNKRHFSNELIVRFIKELNKYKIHVWNQLIFCYPDQTDEDRQSSIDLITELNTVCDPKYLKHTWFKFVVSNGKEEYFYKNYNVKRTTSLQNWENHLYSPSKIETLCRKYEELLPENAEIWI
ncbi:MAG: radical SAM protein [Endomicrobium sp.]|jgi:radical SAM superfamily enzyme YgiQ (UPF0313 family)|nr:radical SAM protein [Endomicrobium sp.]